VYLTFWGGLQWLLPIKFCDAPNVALSGTAIDVLAKMQSTVIAADKVFIVWGKTFRLRGEPLKGRPEEFMVDSSQRRRTTPSGGLYSEVILLVTNYYYGNSSAEYQKSPDAIRESTACRCSAPN
jgi:hypothetical protein